MLLERWGLQQWQDVVENHPAGTLALAGGLPMLLLIDMSLVSIVGRKLFSAPVQMISN